VCQAGCWGVFIVIRVSRCLAHSHIGLDELRKLAPLVGADVPGAAITSELSEGFRSGGRSKTTALPLGTGASRCQQMRCAPTLPFFAASIVLRMMS
jgi:hypothetical protein